MTALLALLTLLLAPAEAATPTTVILGEVRGSINPATGNYLSMLVERAEATQAEAVILTLDTPGGLISSAREMVQVMDASHIPIVLHVRPAGAAATSAGALLMLASHVAAMAPGSNIGAAHPVGAQGDEIKGPAGEKATSDTAAFARGIAEAKGRNKDLAEQIVVKSRSFTAEEALKEKLIDLVVDSESDLIQALEGRSVQIAKATRTLHTKNATVERLPMTPGQRLLHWLADPNIAGLLMSAALLLLYVEISNPGLIVPGILGGICLIVAFISFQLLPITTGGFLLILLGLVLMILEPFIISHGALAIGGIVSFALGMVWVMDPAATSLRVSPMVWIPSTIVMSGIVLILAITTARLNRLARNALAKIGGGGASGLTGYRGTVLSLGEDGKHGKASFRGEIWDFEAQEPLKVGDPIEAVSTHGMTVIVKTP